MRLLNCFLALVTQQNIVHHTDPYMDAVTLNSKFNIQIITENEVTISKLKNSKARDLFGFDTNLLKLLKSCILEPVTHLFNLTITQTVVPFSCKVANVIPIYKSGDKLDSTY